MEILNKIKKNKKIRAILYPVYIYFKTRTRISKTAILKNKRNIKLGKNVDIWDYVVIRALEGTVIIGDNSQINPFTVIYCYKKVIIGKNVMIAPHCMIAGGNHDYLQTVEPMRFAGYLTKGPIIIEDDVWIGANCTITDGITIQRGAVIAANSVVTKNVSSFDVVGGVPAKFLFNRKDKRK